MRMCFTLLLLLGLAAVSCGDRYTENDLELLTHYRAKELCSCLFVMEQTEDYCKLWTTASPNLATFSVDYDEKTVETQAAMFWGAKARDWAELFEPMGTPLWEAMLDSTAVGRGTRLLDLGCGGGGASVLAAERGAQVAGLDAAQALIDIARKRVPKGDFRVGDP